MMRRLIPYAGYDPKENQFAVNGTRLDVDRIRELRSQKKTYQEIGEILAHEEGRPIRYAYETVSQALYRDNRKKREEALCQ